MTRDEVRKVWTYTGRDFNEFLGTFLELERARGNATRMSTGTNCWQAQRAYTKDLVPAEQTDR